MQGEGGRAYCWEWGGEAGSGSVRLRGEIDLGKVGTWVIKVGERVRRGLGKAMNVLYNATLGKR